jgi:hypothetical protein
MAQPIAGSSYTVQQGDSLASIAQRAYGDQDLWQEIQMANSQVIGDNPDALSPGMTLFLLANPLRARLYLTPQSCTVTFGSLNVRIRPTTGATITTSNPQGTVLNFIEVVEGATFNGNPNWGLSTQGHYFWMGGTNRPNG